MEADRFATLHNDSQVDAEVFWADSATSERHRELIAEAGGSATIQLSGSCETGWWVQRDGKDPVQLGKVCPGDDVAVTDHGIEQ